MVCIGIEDADAGVQAIHAASMKTVGIGSAETLSQEDILLHSTGSLTLEQLI